MLNFPPPPFDVVTKRNINIRLQAKTTAAYKGYYTADKTVTVYGIKSVGVGETWGMLTSTVDDNGMGLWMLLENINGAWVTIKNAPATPPASALGLEARIASLEARVARLEAK